MSLKKLLCIFTCFISSFSFTSPAFATNKTIVYSGLNGLCNHLRSLASSAVMAEATNRELVVYWCHPSEAFILAHAKWEDLFISPQFKQISDLPSYGAIQGCKRPSDPQGLRFFAESYQGLNYGEPAYKIHTERERICLYEYTTSPGAEFCIDVPNDDVVVIQTIHNVRLKSMSNEEFLERKRAFYKKLVPVPYVQDAVEMISSQFSSKTIGVHVRGTDLKEYIWKDKPLAYEKYRRAMEKELEKDPETIFFLSADSKQAINYFLNIFREKILFYPDIDYHEGGSFKGHAVRTTIKAQKDALIDLFLLSKTSKIIGTKHSSFSYEAACIGGIELIELDHE